MRLIIRYLFIIKAIFNTNVYNLKNQINILNKIRLRIEALSIQLILVTNL